MLLCFRKQASDVELYELVADRSRRQHPKVCKQKADVFCNSMKELRLSHRHMATCVGKFTVEIASELVNVVMGPTCLSCCSTCAQHNIHISKVLFVHTQHHLLCSSAYLEGCNHVRGSPPSPQSPIGVQNQRASFPPANQVD